MRSVSVIRQKIRCVAALAAFALLVGCGSPRPPAPISRLELIQRRGSVGCGIETAVPGFAEQDAQGRYRGMDIDVCRALSAAIFGTPDRVTYIEARSVEDFLRKDDIDLVTRRITWELKREGTFPLLFGPITFHDGQGFLVRKGVTPAALAATPVCVAGGSVFEINLNEHATRSGVSFTKAILESAHDYADIAARLSDGRCRAYTGDVSDLGAIRVKTQQPGAFEILPGLISEEPLAPLVRRSDAQFFTVLRWTIYALIAAEELGITSENVGAMRSSESLEVRRLLGAQPGNGKALGLNEEWAFSAIQAVGNYGEMFDRNLGAGSAIRLARGANRLFKDGGLMYAPPLR